MILFYSFVNRRCYLNGIMNTAVHRDPCLFSILVSWSIRRAGSQWREGAACCSHCQMNVWKVHGVLSNSLDSRLFTAALWNYHHRSLKVLPLNHAYFFLYLKFKLYYFNKRVCLEICMKLLFCTIWNLTFSH